MFRRSKQHDAAYHKTGTRWYVYLITIAFIFMMLTPMVIKFPLAHAAAQKPKHVDAVTVAGTPKLFNTLSWNQHFYTKGKFHFNGTAGKWEQVRLHYHHSYGPQPPDKSIWVQGSGMHPLPPDDWSLPINLPNGHYYTQVHITAPNNFTSPKAEFDMAAPKPKVLTATFTMPVHAYYGPRKALELPVHVRVTLTPNHTKTPVNFHFLLNGVPNYGAGFQIASPQGINSNVYTRDAVLYFKGNEWSGERKVNMHIGSPNEFYSGPDYIWVHWTN